MCIIIGYPIVMDFFMDLIKHLIDLWILAAVYAIRNEPGNDIKITVS